MSKDSKLIILAVSILWVATMGAVIFFAAQTNGHSQRTVGETSTPVVSEGTVYLPVPQSAKIASQRDLTQIRDDLRNIEVQLTDLAAAQDQQPRVSDEIHAMNVEAAAMKQEIRDLQELVKALGEHVPTLIQRTSALERQLIQMDPSLSVDLTD